MAQVGLLHGAEEMQRISNLAHWGEGAVLALAGVIAMVDAAGYGAGRARYLWPGLIVFAGLALLGYLLLPHHGLEHARDQWAFVFGDPQQRQHVVLAALALVAGAIELAYHAGRLQRPAWQLVWPAAVGTVGLMFARHTQHGTAEAVARAALIHRYLGLLFIATGALRAAEIFGGAHTRWLAFSWPFTLLAAAALLGAYREPAGAYHDGGTAAHEPRTTP